MVAQTLLRDKLFRLDQERDQVLCQLRENGEQLDDELRRIAQGKHPWSDPV
ncbi:MAG: hypothetical protein ACREB3_01255 [Burkholderiales bacterium]